MTVLKAFVESNIPMDLRTARSFTGNRGWVSLANQLLRRLEMEGLVRLTQRKEIGVEVLEDYWITPPSDFRTAIGIYYPPLSDHVQSGRRYPYTIINGKIKLTEPFSKKDTVEEVTLESGTDSQVLVDDDSIEEDQYNRNLLVLTDGTYEDDGIIIGKHDASDAVTGKATLPFVHKRATSIADSTTGYLTDMYLMLQYMATFTGLTAETDEIPVDPRFDTCLISGLCYLATHIGSDDRAKFRDEFEYDLDVLGREEFTPSPDQARPLPRSMAGFEDCSNFYEKHADFHGEFE